MKCSNKLTSVLVAGEFWQDNAIDRSAAGEKVWIPESSIDSGDLVFRVRSPLPEHGMEAGDLLIVEPRDTDDARNGELVIVIGGERAVIGHWWAKHQTRVLLDDSSGFITGEKAMQLFGAITVIVRPHT